MSDYRRTISLPRVCKKLTLEAAFPIAELGVRKRVSKAGGKLFSCFRYQFSRPPPRYYDFVPNRDVRPALSSTLHRFLLTSPCRADRGRTG